MKDNFKGWSAVAARLRECSSDDTGWLDAGQKASLTAISERITEHGVLIADEVGMGKTRIAVELARIVIESGGRVAILVPPGLGYQWQKELRDRGVEAPAILRSMSGYFRAWDASEENHNPWLESNLVMVSHAFTNWRIGGSTPAWRWALLPELYAHWRKRLTKRFPRGYDQGAIERSNIKYVQVVKAARSIVASIPDDLHHLAYKPISSICEQPLWPQVAKANDEYGRDQSLRCYLEQAVGLGLGVFNLIVIDEAHKSRGQESGLSRLLDTVLLSAQDSRRFAMTATPVELDIDQWWQILNRIGLTESQLSCLAEGSNPIHEYARAVKRLRNNWRSETSRELFAKAAVRFSETLQPYVLRRDKREDFAVKQFEHYSGLNLNEYRDLSSDIKVEPRLLTQNWRQAICATEALSLTARQSSENSESKRLRLTMGNGHGIAALLDQNNHIASAACALPGEQDAETPEIAEDSSSKSHQRTKWWLAILNSSFVEGENVLFEHPAIVAAVDAIEKYTAKGEKVLVFGKFTRPLRALTQLLNAREMLRRIYSSPPRPWPQSKIHNVRDTTSSNGDLFAVLAAHSQLSSELELRPFSEDEVNRTLLAQYGDLEARRKKFRERLIDQLEAGFQQQGSSQASDSRNDHGLNAFEALKRSGISTPDENDLAMISRILMELLGQTEEPAPSIIEVSDLVRAFRDVIASATDRDDPDVDSNGDGQIDDEEADKYWRNVTDRLKEEYSRTEGDFARLMNGDTPQSSRRLIQLAFNRPNSNPQVLIAQSLVGREGLNLHESCRIIVLLHPEWNPGVVEQQIGRIDRVGSHWSKMLQKAIEDGAPAPRIEVRPVVFCGTYDEHNWNVLRERWDDLRAQLHGLVVSEKLADGDLEGKQLLKEIDAATPNFSPGSRK